MKPIVRVPLALLVTSAVISLGVIGVHASEECIRFIQKKQHHSAATLAAWAAWDKAHPNWHPKNRPLGETMAALDFACSVPLIQKPIDTEFTPIQVSFDLPMDELPPPQAPPVTVADNTPPQLFDDAPPLPLVSPPIYSPDYPTISGIPPIPPHQASVGVTPEPSTWMLLATALLAIGLSTRRRLAPQPVVAAR